MFVAMSNFTDIVYKIENGFNAYNILYIITIFCHMHNEQWIKWTWNKWQIPTIHISTNIFKNSLTLFLVEQKSKIDTLV